MRNLFVRILIVVTGVLIGFGGVAGILFLFQDQKASYPIDRINPTQEAEPLSLSDVPENADVSKLSTNIFEPLRVKELVFPERTFDWKTRIVIWVNALTNDQVLSWLEQSTDSSWNVSLAIRRELQTKLLQKLATTVPDRAVDFSLARDHRQQRYSMANVVFQAWANLDIDGAVARAKELNEQESLYFMGTILKARDDLSLEQMRDVAIELGDESYAFTVYFQNLTKGEIENPRETWYEIFNLANRESVQHTSGSALFRVAVAWVKKQGIKVLDEIVSSISDNVEYSSILYDTLGVLASDQPDEVFDFVMSNLGDQAVNVIRESGITNHWVRKDPTGLFAKIQTLPASRLQRLIVRDAIVQWAQNTPHELLTQLDIVPPGQRDFASHQAIKEFTRKTPLKAAQFVLQMTDDATQSRLARILIPQWTEDDAEAAKDWVLGLPSSEPMRASLIFQLTKSLVRTNPMDAFELALQQPLDNNENSPYESIGDEVFILSRIANQDVQLAMELLSKVRTGGRLSAYTDVGVTLVEQGNLREALQLAKQLSDTEQSKYYQSIAMNWLWNDPKGLLKAVDQFPSSSKSRIAVAMTFSNKISSYYSAEEIAHLERLISERDKELLKQLHEIDLSDPTEEDFELFNELHL